MLDDLGLIPALEWQARETSRRTGIDVRVSAEDVDDNRFRTPSAHASIAWRRKRCRTSRGIQAHHTRRSGSRQLDGVLSLTIEDEVPALNPQRTRGMGLLGMEERVRQLGGRLEVRSKPANGTTVRVSLPVPAARSPPAQEMMPLRTA